MTTTPPMTAPLAHLTGTPARRAAAVAGAIALIALGAKVQVPFWPVPMTLQTLALMLVFSLVGLRLSLATITGYLGLGLLGLPVFAGPAAGPAYFAGPTAGFLAGFVLAALIVGAAADRGWTRRILPLFLAMLAADAAIFALGFLWLAFVFGIGAETAFAKGVQPYLLADLVKLGVAALLVRQGVRWPGRGGPSLQG